MDISHKLPEISILLANDGFVSILKKLAVPGVSAVEIDCITRQKPLHELGDASLTAPKKKVGVIGHEHPCVTDRFSFWKQDRKPLKEILPVSIIFEERATFYSSNNDMVQYTWGV